MDAATHSTTDLHGGTLIGEVLARQGVRLLYTLCGGHISPILVGAAAAGIRVIDVRHEATALYAADANARLTGMPGVAAVGNDAGWTQIAREQVELLGTGLGTELAYTDYHRVAEGYGGVGFCVRAAEEVEATLRQAQAIAQTGKPVLVNVLLGKSEFRKGSISV